MNTWRQGDVLFKQVKEIPRGGKVRKSGHILEGEATGHIHRVAEAELENAEVLEVGEGLYLNVSVESGVSIVHEEHKAISLPKGKYEILRQREYAPDEIRNVAD